MLNFDRATKGVYRAVKRCEESISGIFYDATAVGDDTGVDRVDPKGTQSCVSLEF